MRHGQLFGLALLACFAFSVVAQADETKQQERPNVLLIVSDDLNCDLGCYGHPQVRTPHLDALAQRGVRFERTYCQFPVCNQSRSSFLTGRRPNVTRVFSNPGQSDHPHFRDAIPNTVTLPEMFRQHGYYVARVGKLYHFNVPAGIGTNGLDDPQSWDEVVNPIGRDRHEESKIFTLEPGWFGATLSWLAAEGTDEEQTDGIGATEAIRLLEAHRDEPFFLAVGFYRPHTPYVAPKKYFDLYPLDDVKLPQLSEEDRQREPAAAYASLHRVEKTMTDYQRRQAIQAYWASISFLDAQVGRVLDALRRLGLEENTIVLFTSDHGYHMYEHGLWQKRSLFENSARVPLIVAAPGVASEGQATPALAELVDLYPTLAALCDLPSPEYLDGKSLVPVLQDPSQQVRDAAFTQTEHRDVRGCSVRTDRWRYVRWTRPEPANQLYDMQADPRETKNLAGDPRYADVVKELDQRIADYMANYQAR